MNDGNKTETFTPAEESTLIADEEFGTDSSNKLWLVIAGVGCLAALIMGVVVIAGGNPDIETPERASADQGSDGGELLAGASREVPEYDENGDPVAAPTASTAPPPATAAGDDENTGPLVPAIPAFSRYKAGKLYLEGAYPNQERLDRAIEKSIEVMGADNVIVNATIDPRVETSEAGRVIIDDPTTFPVGSAAILPETEQLLALGIVVMNLNPEATMTITGHTDDAGSLEANQALSEARAQAMADYIIAGGIDPARIRTEGKGETEPIASNESEDGRAKNRRIEVELFDLL